MSTKSLALNGAEMLPQDASWSLRQLASQLERLKYGSLVLKVRDHAPVSFIADHTGPHGELHVRNPQRLLHRLFWRGDVGFAESYMAGEWHTPDITGLLHVLSRNLELLEQGDARHPLVAALLALRHRSNRNTLKGSRRNIAAHYDLGNDFYQRWLDTTMTYSAAVFDDGGDLEMAQRRKYDLILDQLDAEPGAHILEIGCGWGGFAEHAARWGYRVTGITLSREQLAYAQARIDKAGLGDQVELKLCDYREIDQTFDHVVSIEMFEAVGKEYWRDYFTGLFRCLRPRGRAVLQVITIDESMYADYERNPGGFIQQYIFPGGMLPTKSHLRQLTREALLEPLSMQAHGNDYADTLAHWLKRFDAESTWMHAHGYDERFCRTWRYYLAFCEAGFRDNRIDVVHHLLEKP